MDFEWSLLCAGTYASVLESGYLSAHVFYFL